MPVAIFDLDNTLITSDSDFLWGEFLVEHNIVDPLEYEQKNRQFYQDYQQGRSSSRWWPPVPRHCWINIASVVTRC